MDRSRLRRRAPAPRPPHARPRPGRRVGAPGLRPSGCRRHDPARTPRLRAPRQPLHRGGDRSMTTTPSPGAPGRPLPRRQQHHGVERPAAAQPDRLRRLRALRPHGRARPVRLPVPRRGAAAARAQGTHPRPRRRRSPEHARGAHGAGRRHSPHRPRRHAQRHVQRAVRAGPPARDARPSVERARRLERRHELGCVPRRELPPWRLPRPRRPLPREPRSS